MPAASTTAYTRDMVMLDVPPVRHRLSASVRSVRRILPMAGCVVPASTLRDPAVAAWVRANGVSVAVCTGADLDVVAAGGVRPAHVLLRCLRDTATIRRSVAAGVRRFVVSGDRHVDVLSSCATGANHVYLDERGPVVLGEQRLDIVGMHCDVDESAGTESWMVAVDRLMARMAWMRSCGLNTSRISLSGAAVAPWLAGDVRTLTDIATSIDDALDAGCARWRLPRPAVMWGPSDDGTGPDVSGR